jgi:hypothetical protein
MPVLQLLLVLFVALTLGGCEAIATIFEAGMWVGVIGVLAVVALVVFIVSLFRR